MLNISSQQVILFDNNHEKQYIVWNHTHTKIFSVYYFVKYFCSHEDLRPSVAPQFIEHSPALLLIEREASNINRWTDTLTLKNLPDFFFQGLFNKSHQLVLKRIWIIIIRIKAKTIIVQNMKVYTMSMSVWYIIYGKHGIITRNVLLWYRPDL